MSLILKEKIISNVEILSDIYELKFLSEYISDKAKPGQFINVKCSDGIDPILRRPLSICSIDEKNKSVIVTFRKKGRGTAYLAEKKSGDLLDLVGPLGNGFENSKKYRNIAVVGGGIGIFPLLFLLQQKSADSFCNITAYIGFETKSKIILENEFAQCCNNLLLSTDDGSKGYKGFITDLLEYDLMQRKNEDEKYDIIYSCGPVPMMKKVAETAMRQRIKCQVSLEQRMGCGIGACLSCVCKIKQNQNNDWIYKRVCKDGPVFWGEEVDFDDLCKYNV
jgi:dihydroorotate dehydrogenase electron transfer subunit